MTYASNSQWRKY